MATLPGGGPAEDGSELRSHACGVAKVEARGHAPGVGRIVMHSCPFTPQALRYRLRLPCPCTRAARPLTPPMTPHPAPRVLVLPPPLSADLSATEPQPHPRPLLRPRTRHPHWMEM